MPPSLSNLESETSILCFLRYLQPDAISFMSSNFPEELVCKCILFMQYGATVSF